ELEHDRKSRRPASQLDCRNLSSSFLIFPSYFSSMAVQVYGCNHVAIEVGDVKKAVAFYKDVFNLEPLNEGEGDAFFKLGQHQFLALFETKNLQSDRGKHFGLIVRDDAQITEIRDKLTTKYKIKLIPPF